MTDDVEPLLEGHRVAKRLGVRRAEIYEWVRTASCPAYRVGKNGLRFRWSEVTSWLESRRTGGTR